MKAALDRLYAAFNHPDSALDPIQIVRRYARLEDREIVAFVAAGLAFGRVASVMASVEAVCRGDGAGAGRVRPRVRSGPRRRAASAARASLDARRRFRRAALDAAAAARGARIARARVRRRARPGGRRCRCRARAVLRRARARSICGRRTAACRRRRACYYFFARPSTGSACKRLNLFLRWMVRRDGVDPGGWTTRARAPARRAARHAHDSRRAAACG